MSSSTISFLYVHEAINLLAIILFYDMDGVCLLLYTQISHVVPSFSVHCNIVYHMVVYILKSSDSSNTGKSELVKYRNTDVVAGELNEADYLHADRCISNKERESNKMCWDMFQK